ncbi:MAG: helix-turn-helix domain-containing protein [Lachnospiraceae bacterium]|nr:helix-turn-helix domain-containing protein [Lachnospiraceae bacterium]
MKIENTHSNISILKEMGQRIKDIRIGQSLTQKELCEKAGVSFNTVVRIENGEGSNINNLMRIMRALGLIENFNLLIPEQEQLPEEAFKSEYKRKRVSKSRLDKVEWQWGDEK